MLDDNTILRHSPGLGERSVLPDGLVIQMGDKVHTMNETAREIFELCDGSRCVGEIVSEIKGHYPDSDDVTRLDPPVIPDECRRYGLTDDFSFVFFDWYYEPTTTLSSIVFPNRRPGNTIISEIGELETLRRLLPLGFNFYRAPDGRAGDLAWLLKKVRAYTIDYEDHWEVVDGIRELIGHRR